MVQRTHRPAATPRRVDKRKRPLDAVKLWATHWNDDPRPFVWKATADHIITKGRGGRATCTPGPIRRRTTRLAGVAPGLSAGEGRSEPADCDGGLRDRAAEQRDVEALRRDGVAEQRGDGAGERDTDAGERDLAAADRDRDGRERDEAAALRDKADTCRDDAAKVRDSAAEQRDRPVHARDTEQAAFGRLVRAGRAAASDREHARQDRGAGVLACGLAGPDRGSAGQDRAHSGSDRDAAERDREAALGNRGAGDDERSLAVLDRSRALGDRADAAADRRSASLDEPTGAYLRRPGLLQLERDVSRAKRSGEPLVVAFVDVDQLKNVNDQGGHAAGDRLLHHVAGTLQAQLRPYDLIIRFGGDEFVCVVAGLGQHEVGQRLAHVNTVLAHEAAPSSVTVGLAQLQPEDAAHDLIERADRACMSNVPTGRAAEATCCRLDAVRAQSAPAVSAVVGLGQGVCNRPAVGVMLRLCVPGGHPDPSPRSALKGSVSLTGAAAA